MSFHLAGEWFEWTLIYRMLISTSAPLMAGLLEPIDATWPLWRWVCQALDWFAQLNWTVIHTYCVTSTQGSKWKTSKSVCLVTNVGIRFTLNDTANNITTKLKCTVDTKHHLMFIYANISHSVPRLQGRFMFLSHMKLCQRQLQLVSAITSVKVALSWNMMCLSDTECTALRETR